jgi:hypothetical protein
MSFSRINSSGWALGDPLTHTQITNLDIDHANSLDKSTAGDVILGAVNVGGAAGTGALYLPIESALNWSPPVVVDATFALTRGVFCVKDQVWYGVGSGGSDWFMTSQDYGVTWTKPTLGSSLTLQDVACDASGNVLLVSVTKDIYFGTHAAYGSVTFTHTANALSATPTDGATATYDSANALFIVAFLVGSGVPGQTLNTSSNGTTFTSRTLPSAWSSYTGSNPPRVHSRSGTTVAAFYDDSASLFRIIRSTNGTTWADEADVATAFVPTEVSKPTYDSVSATWYIALAGAPSGTRKTQVFYSTDDGVTWSSVTWAANDFRAQGLLALNGLLVAVNDDGRIAVSRASGASMAFSWMGMATSTASAITAALGGGGIGVFYSGARKFMASKRYENAGQSI